MLKVCRWLVLCAHISIVCGCATLRPSGEPVVQSAPVATDILPDGEGWWYARFQIDRPVDESPRWHIGTLIAGEVIAPIFDRHYRDILIWRIHRRAGDDDDGHMFSFIFYATAAGAQRVYNGIAQNPLVQRLEQDGLIKQVLFDDVRQITRPAIGDTSDPEWLPVVRQTWPALIMGASRMWLDMVSELATKQSGDAGLEQKYLAVNNEIKRIWSEQGQHAVLHHLSGVYAYEPLLIRY